MAVYGCRIHACGDGVNQATIAFAVVGHAGKMSGPRGDYLPFLWNDFVM
jgi:hypothetical protein